MDVNEVIKDFHSLKIVNKRRMWKPFMIKYDCQVICEIGVDAGKNFWRMIQHNPRIAVAIDSWKNDGIASHNDKAASQKVLDALYEYFVNSMKDREGIEIYREYSTEAVKRFKDNYFDLIYIDADHTYEGCYRDICDWYPKVKSGGFLLGDDYREATIRETGVVFGVIKAVNQFAMENDLFFFEIPRFGWGIVKP